MSTGTGTRITSTTTVARLPATSKYRLDMQRLDVVVDFLHGQALAVSGQALAASIQKIYSSTKRRYVNFCVCHDIVPLPTNELTKCRYVAILAGECVSTSSIHCYLSAICHFHIEEGWGDPSLSSLPKLELVGKSGQFKPRLPITPDLLQKLRTIWLASILAARKSTCYGRPPPLAALSFSGYSTL